MSGARPSYDHLEPGTPEATWAACDRWSTLPDAADLLRGVDRLVVVSAHPDDETLGVGGLIVLASRLGLAIRFVLATDGEASHPNSPTLTPAQLARLRRTEYDAALALLAPGADVVGLGLPDAGLAGAPHQLEGALFDALSQHNPRAGLSEAAGNAHQVGEEQAGGDRVLVLAPWRHDGHGDHEAAGAAAAAVVRSVRAQGRAVTLLEYPIWLWHWGGPSDVPWADGRLLRLAPDVRELKAAAIDAHASQVAPLSPAPGDEPILHEAALAHFTRPFEVVIAASP